MKILIVDDSKAMRMIVRRTLRKAGYGEHDLEEACNGVEGLEAVKRSSPDLVLCDWNMPEMNGLELLKALKSGNILPNFGFITTEGSAEMRSQAMTEGALFLITKPFTAEIFQRELGPLLD